MTTNEDDLLERAGCQRVLHVHGDIFETQCAEKCGWRVRDIADNAASFARCPKCGAAVRPGSVWFGEALSPAVLTALKNFEANACLVVGSSGTVQPISGMPLELAHAGLPVVEVNPHETPLSKHVTHLPWTAAEVLPALVDLLTSATVRATSRQRRWTRTEQ